MASTSLKGSKVWLELCTEEQDWRAFGLFCAKAFEDAPFAHRYLPDLEKRKRFLPHYFDYHYETKFKDGRGGLACVKALKPGSTGPEIIFGSAIALKPELFTEGDKSKMMKAYPAGTKAMLRRDEWYASQICVPMAEAARSLGTVAWYGMYQAAANEYQNVGIAKRYLLDSRRMLEDDALRKVTEEHGADAVKNMLPITYGILIMSNPKVRRFLLSKLVEVAHLHYNFKPGLKCMDDPTASSEADISCVYVVVSSPTLAYDHFIPRLRKYFEQCRAKL